MHWFFFQPGGPEWLCPAAAPSRGAGGMPGQAEERQLPPVIEDLAAVKTAVVLYVIHR